ncbi:hypothetical protein [Sphingomonas endolithica]|uniref:hypothetical protein n=1 Tax=Sphingomonas endolithica TaxID=2972485 RepID=UPI0021B08B0D|nr:hypothetical protein [Sphingomonas sp. ZFBP2030]
MIDNQRKNTRRWLKVAIGALAVTIVGVLVANHLQIQLISNVTNWIAGLAG